MRAAAVCACLVAGAGCGGTAAGLPSSETQPAGDSLFAQLALDVPSDNARAELAANNDRLRTDPGPGPRVAFEAAGFRRAVGEPAPGVENFDQIWIAGIATIR